MSGSDQTIQLEEEFIDDSDNQIILADERYRIIGDILCETYQPGEGKWTLSDMLDKVFLHKYLGIPIFLVIMWSMFHFTFQASVVFMVIIQNFFDWVGGYASQIPIPWLASLLSNGLIAGVGFILSFVPPVFFLYLAISILEDTGYLARAAFVMDRVMVKMGLHGRSFIPLLLGFGCSVAAVMAARTVDGKANRFTTILVSPLMSCAGRLPLYVLIAGIFFPTIAGTVVFFMYILGIIMAVVMATIFKKTLFREESSPLLMELSMYQIPTVHGAIHHMWERGVLFLRQAGTYLLAGSVVIWMLSSFGPNGFGVPVQESFISIIGQFIQPLFAPLGFDWRIVVALIFGLMAKEAVVQSLAIIYSVQSDTAIAASLLASISPITAFALMVFVLLYVPCIATIGAIRKETESWKWTLLAVSYQMIVAYLMAGLIISLGGILFG
ncbi:MAG: ferrous iron transport protein B [Candidatus Lokiarchaeota archaeon]|nr:ferrous iron transport protein B [Candidatus Lokiarchaeota archaeon]